MRVRVRAFALTLMICLACISTASTADARAGLGINLYFYPGESDGYAIPSKSGTCDVKIGTNISYGWGEYSAPGSCPTDYFYGYGAADIIGPITGTVYFCSLNDDGMRVVIGKSEVISQWGTHAPDYDNCNQKSSMKMVRGKEYPIQVWYQEYQYGTMLQLWWRTSPGGTVLGDFEPVPVSSFRTAR